MQEANEVLFTEQEFRQAMQEMTERSMREKGFDITTKEGLEAAKLYLRTEDPYISGFDSDPIGYFEGVDTDDPEAMEEAEAAEEMDRMMGDMRVTMMLACLEARNLPQAVDFSAH